MWLALIIGLAFAASVGFGVVQTWNLRHCQQSFAVTIASYAVALEKQNDKVKDWEGKATQAQTKAVQAGKKAAEVARIAKEREKSILGQPGPSGATCEDREKATLDLLRRYRVP